MECVSSHSIPAKILLMGVSMGKFVELSNKRVGKLLVLERSDNNIHGSTMWLCRCDCGNIKNIQASSLVNKQTKSCGCLKRSLILPYTEASFRRYFNALKMNAKQRNIPVTLTEDDIRTITKQNCHYCGIEPKQVFTTPKSNGNYIYNGIDRVDSLLSYNIDNVVPCCARCNEAKNNVPLNEYKEWIKRTYNHLFGGTCGV